MSGKLLPLIRKEILELLRDPKILFGMIIMPLIIFPVMGLAVGAGMRTATERAAKVTVALLDLDNGNYSRGLKAFIEALPNATLIEVSTSNVTQAIEEARREGAQALIVVPEGFSENVSRCLRAGVDVYAFVDSFSMSGMAGSGAVTGILRSYERVLSADMVARRAPGVDPQVVLDPLRLSERTVVRGRLVDVPPGALIGVVMGQTAMMPFVVMMMLMLAMQMAATSIASEKEEKTLETLLTLPVSRLNILIGKLAGSVLVALLGTVSYVVGFTIYMGSITSAVPVSGGEVDLSSLGIGMTPLGYVALGATMFMAILSSLALAISVAVFAEDVRGAQALLGYLFIPLFIPAIVLSMVDVSELPAPAAIALYAIPYSHVMKAVKDLPLGDYTSTIIALAYLSAFTLATLYVAAKIFSTEKILTARLRIGRRRRRVEEVG